MKLISCPIRLTNISEKEQLLFLQDDLVKSRLVKVLFSNLILGNTNKFFITVAIYHYLVFLEQAQ